MTWFKQAYAILLNMSDSIQIPSFEEVIESHEEAPVVQMLHDDEGLSDMNDISPDIVC